MEKEWHRIISFNGSQANAFEELVCQIALNENESKFTTFERVGTPDGGVECYWQLNDNTEWGWQAKFYETLGSSEWNYIKKSPFDAVNTHQALTRYYICVPHNLSDDRRGKNTQKTVWEKYKTAWESQLLKKGRKVEIRFWNSSTLFSKLIISQYFGIKSFFFKDIEINADQLFKFDLNQSYCYFSLLNYSFLL